MNRNEQKAAKAMAIIVADSVATYIEEFTKEVFTNYRSPQSQNTIVIGLAAAIAAYQAHTGVPIAKTLAYTLLDEVKPK